MLSRIFLQKIWRKFSSNAESQTLVSPILSQQTRANNFNQNYPHQNHCIPSLHKWFVGKIPPTETALADQPDTTKWSEYLLIVLLRLLRSTIKEDIKSDTVEMAYGTTLRLPGESFIQPNQKATSISNYVSRLRQLMAKLSFTLTFVHSNLTYLPLIINVSGFVFVCRETIKKSLQPNYQGPYKY